MQVRAASHRNGTGTDRLKQHKISTAGSLPVPLMTGGGDDRGLLSVVGLFAPPQLFLDGLANELRALVVPGNGINPLHW